MNRCRVVISSFGLGWTLALGLAPIAHAQIGTTAPVWLSGANPYSQRQFPPKAKRATLTVVNTQEVTLNGKTVRLAPAARIRTVTNAVVHSGVLIGQTFTVNYINDHMEQVLEVWILTEAEIRQRLPTDTSTTKHFLDTDTER